MGKNIFALSVFFIMAKTKNRQSNNDGIVITFMPSKAESLLLAQQHDNAVPANDIHLTLAFIGRLDETDLSQDDLTAVLLEFAAVHSPIAGTINGSGVFSNTDLNVVYASFDSPELPAFRQALVEHLASNNITHSQEHGFIPHLSLFRVAQDEGFELPVLPTIQLTFDKLFLGHGDDRIEIPMQQTHHDEKERAESDAPNYREHDTEGERCDTCSFAKDGFCELYDFSYLDNWVCDSWQPVTSTKKEQRMPINKNDINTLDRVIGWLKNLIKREIKEVGTWDGSPTNYSDTDAYCQACLIDVNAAAGREEKVQSHCMLPVREDGDSAATFVDKAVFAAAGGRGITQVEKPEDVPQDAWDAAVARAANQIIDAYEEMDLIAPDSIFEVAGKEPPEESQERSLSVQNAWQQIWATIDQLDQESGMWSWPMDIYIDNGNMFLIMARDGKLFRADIEVVDDILTLSNETQVTEVFVPVSQTRIVRKADGRSRVIQIVATAVLNRVGEIDSRTLFDSFINHANDHDEWPVIDVLHFNEIRIGQVVPGGLLRDGSCYIAVWDFDDTDIGRAAEKGFTADLDFWGASIEFEATERELSEVAEGVSVPVYLSGINRFITVAPEQMAASLYTGKKVERSKHMNEKNLEVLSKLFDGNDEIVDEAAALVDGTNQTIVQTKQITRQSKENDAPIPQVVNIDLGDEKMASAVAQAMAQEPALQESITQQISEHLAEMQPLVTEMQQRLTDVVSRLDEMTTSNEAMATRLAELEIDDGKKREKWLADLPAQTVNVAYTHRPRTARADRGDDEDSNGQGSMADIANATISKWEETSKRQ